MSRSGYYDDSDDWWGHIRWRGAVKSAFRGRRGQAFLKEALRALDALPRPRLIKNNLVEKNGNFCMIGAVGRARKITSAVKEIDPEDYSRVAGTFGIAEAMAREIMYENDEGGDLDETPRERWLRMRAWIKREIARKKDKAA